MKGKCLLFNYHQINSKTSGSIQVFLRNEDLHVELLKSVSFSDLPTDLADRWHKLIIKLPESNELKQVIIRGARIANKFSGMAIDDLTIRKCSDLRKLDNSFVIYFVKYYL